MENLSSYFFGGVLYFSYIFYFYYNNNGLLVVTIIKLDLAGPLGVCLAYVWNFVSVYLI
jgi:hypothetical protein